MEQGLASQLMGSQPQATTVPTVDQIVQALMQGVSPDELVAQGVPEELIIQAIQLIEQQMQSQAPQQQAPAGNPGDGLARMMTGGM